MQITDFSEHNNKTRQITVQYFLLIQQQIINITHNKSTIVIISIPNLAILCYD